MLAQLFENDSCLREIPRIEPFREPRVDGRELTSRFASAAGVGGDVCCQRDTRIVGVQAECRQGVDSGGRAAEIAALRADHDAEIADLRAHHDAEIEELRQRLVELQQLVSRFAPVNEEK